MMGEIKQGKDGNFYEKTAQGWVPAQAPAMEASAPTERPSLMERVQRGASRAPASLMRTVAQGMNYIDSRPVFSEWVGGPPFQSAFGVDTQALVDAPWDAASDEAHRRVFGRDPVTTPPEGIMEKTAEGIGGGLATPVPGAPGGGTVGGLMLEGLGLAGGSLAGAAADEVGLPWWAQMGLSIGGSVAPSMAGRSIATRMAGAEARSAADDVLDTMKWRAGTESAPDFMPPSARPGTILNASSELKTMIPRGFEDEAASRLDDVLEAFPEARTRPTTSQALDELGGETMESATMGLSRGDRTFSRNLAGQKLSAVRAVDDDLAALRPSGDLPTAQAAYEATVDAAIQSERAAWNAVPMDLMPQVPTRGLKRAAEEIRAGVGVAGAKNLPDELATVLEYGDNVPFSELQSLRSELLAVERAGRSPMASAKATRQSAHAARLRQHVDDLIDDVAENSQITGQPLKPGTASTVQRQEGVAALRDAQRITRENRELFDPRSPVVRAFENPKEAKDIANGLIRGGPRDARRAMTMFRQNQAAQDSVRRIVMDELIGPDILTEGAAKSAMKRLREKRETAVALFGAEHVQNVERLLRKARTVRSGRAGTRAGGLGTGSGTLSASQQMVKESAQELIGQRGMTLADMAAWIPKKVASTYRDLADADFQRVMAAAVIDPELARDLLRIPGPAALPKWATRMRGHLARNGIRVVARDGGNVSE